MARTAATVAGQLFCGAAIFADHEVRCQTRSPVDECGAAHRSRVTLPHRPSAFTGESDRKKPGGELQSSAGNNTDAGARALCTHFSLLRTAKQHGHEPYRYFLHILREVPHCRGVEDFEALLPWRVRFDVHRRNAA